MCKSLRFIRPVAFMAVLGSMLTSASWSHAAEYAPADRIGAEVVPAPVAVSPVVVSSRRFAQKSFEVERSLQTVDADQLRELQASGAPEALHETTGVLVQKTNRGAGAPILRGMIGPANLLVVDGIRFNNATFRTGPNQYLAMLDPVSFSRFEVMMGPASVLYGSDAMGGVIQAVPHDWPEKAQTAGETGLRFGSADKAATVWGRAAWQAEGTGVQAAAALRRFGQLRAGGGVMQPISDYLQGSWSLRGRHEIAPGTELRLAWFGTRIRDAGRADRINSGDFRFYDNDDDLGWLELRHKGRGKGSRRPARGAATIHRTNENVDRYRCTVNDVATDVAGCVDAAVAQRGGGFGVNDSIPSPDAPLTRQTTNNDTVWSPGGLAMGQWALLQGALLLSAGLEGQFDLVSDSAKEERRADKGWTWKQADRGNFSNDSTYTSVATFLMAEFDLLERADDVVVATAGVRLSQLRARAAAVPGVGDLVYDHTGAVGSIGLRWLHGRNAMAYVNASQGFRAPNLQEVTVLGDTGSKFEVPNGDLGPERSNAFELGARWRRGEIEVHGAAFANLVDDVIDEKELTSEQWSDLPIDAKEVGSKTVVQRFNSPGGTFLGAELTARGPRFKRLQPWARVAWIRGEIERKGETVPARRSPPPMGAGGLRWDAASRRWFVEFYSRFAGAQADLHPSDESDLRICEDPNTPGKTYSKSGTQCPGSPAWWTLNARGGFAFNDKLRLDATVHNALDVPYRYHGSGFDEAGLGVTASVVGTF